MERRIPTREEVQAYLKDDRNWGRWGKDDQKGAVNLITPEKRISAARLVKSGQAISLSREFPKTPAPNNPFPAVHYMKQHTRGEGAGACVDYLGIGFHGNATTHLDALCHAWDADGHVERPGPVARDNHGRRRVGFHRPMEGRHHDPRRSAGRPQTPRRALRHPREAGARLGVGRHRQR